MEIHLKNIIPHPLAERDLSQSQVWNKDIRFMPGKAIHIYAPSGTGKSTLIHTLYGLRKDYTGEILIDNINLKNSNYKSAPAIRKNNLSIVFQDMRLFPELSAEENIKIKSQLTHTTTQEEITDMTQQLGIAHLMKNMCGVLSLGEQQRLAIVRALCSPFEWLLLDEPFSHLDEKNIEKAINLIKQVCKKNNAGFILVSLGYEYGLQYDYSYML